MSFERVEIVDAVLYRADCLAVLPTLSGIDAVITDPPYSSGGFTRGDRTGSTKQKYMNTESSNRQVLEDFTGDNRDQRGFHFWSALWASAALQASKPGAVACFFADWRQLPISTDYLQAGGWVWRGIVPWSKRGARPQMGRFGAQCEYVAWGSSGPLPTDRGVGCLPGFFDHTTSRDRHHITEKPVELMSEIVDIVPPQALVLDCFMGGGTTGVACARTGRRFIGIELTTHHFDTACRRIEDAYRQGQLVEPTQSRTTEQVDLLGG